MKGIVTTKENTPIETKGVKKSNSSYKNCPMLVL